MTTKPTIRSLIDGAIERRIEEVIKVDQTDAQILRTELDEYVVTPAIKKHFVRILDRYRETPNKPHEGIGVWVSGFFGSGKSSFAKILGLILANRDVMGSPAARLFSDKVGDAEVRVLLDAINEQIPTHAVILDVSTDLGIKSSDQPLTAIAYRKLLESLGYARDLDLAQLEIELEGDGRLDEFKETYRKELATDWDREKGKPAFAFGGASRVMHLLDPKRFGSDEAWARAAQDRADVSPNILAERCTLLMNRRKPGHSLVFVIDEVGQFVARDIRKMLDLQGIVQALGVHGQGRHWLVATSQERLTEIVAGLDDKLTELSRLMDRFPQELQVHLEPSDISEVTSRRVLKKNAAGEGILQRLYADNQARLAQATRISADMRMPELTAQSFVDLYPLLPYQIDLVISVVSGLRTQGGASRHVGGANRTIIKLAQQLLVHKDAGMADRPAAELVTLDRIYDLVEGNIATDVRAKIAAISNAVPHPLAKAVAKAICLLRFAPRIACNDENIAAVLFPAVDADSRLASVKDALVALTKAHLVRLGDDGYRIPTPAEDDWERIRAGVGPKLAEAARIQADEIAKLWAPQPNHHLLDSKTFKAGLSINGRPVVDGGDVLVNMYLDPAGDEHAGRVAELRSRSQEEKMTIFWAVPLDPAIAHETTELFRSQAVLEHKGRDAAPGTGHLIAEEKRRLVRHQDELRRLLKKACLAGRVYFQGNDRSPPDNATDVAREVSALLGKSLLGIFDRFPEAAARVVPKRDLEALLTNENLHGLPPIFTTLKLLRDANGTVAFQTDTNPVAEVQRRIEKRAEYGEMASGKYLAAELEKPPFGWDFEVVRLFVLCLLRAGKIEVTRGGQTFESALSLEARETFTDNAKFRSATFRPKQGLEFQHVASAASAFEEVFGKEVKEIEEGKVAAAIREELAASEETLGAAYAKLARADLPGASRLDAAVAEVRGLRRASVKNTIVGFADAWRTIRDALGHAAQVQQCLTDPALRDVARAREVLRGECPFLLNEPDLPDDVRAAAGALEDLLRRDTFFRELPAIGQKARVLTDEYQRRFDEACRRRSEAYTRAYQRLVSTEGWDLLDEERRGRIAAPIAARMEPEHPRPPIPLLRADTDACTQRLMAALEQLLQAVEGDRVQSVAVDRHFNRPIETADQLEEALESLREECARLIATGKKVVLR